MALAFDPKQEQTQTYPFIAKRGATDEGRVSRKKRENIANQSCKFTNNGVAKNQSE